MENKREIIDQYTKNLIVEDGKSILDCFYGLIDSGILPAVIFLLMPYIALYCEEAEKYLKEKGELAEIIVGKETKEVAGNLRNILKTFTQENRKTIKKVKEICLKEDQRYYELDGPFHMNLGVFLTSDKKIISNSHMMFFDREKLFYKPDNEIKLIANNTGERLGIFVRKILGHFNVYYERRENKANIEAGHFDTNIFWPRNFIKYSNELTWPYCMELLHLLSFLGFSNNIVSKIMAVENLWAFRLRYTIVHMVIRALGELKKKIATKPLNNEELSNQLKPLSKEEIINFGKNTVISSTFRSCMMHYSFYNKDRLSIEEKYIDCEKPFCGLVESCFQKSFAEYNAELIEFSLRLESLLLQFFNIDENAIEWDLGGDTE